MKKVYDIVATTGNYTDRDGNDKRRYTNVGAVFKGDNGPFIVFKRWFNPAACEPSKPGEDSIYLSLFEPKEGEQSRPAPKPAPRAAPRREEVVDMADDIPF